MSAPLRIKTRVYLDNPDSQAAKDECNKLAESLKLTSCLIVEDDRVTFEDNATFIDLMEKYFCQPLPDKMKDVFPKLHYQVGATPEFTECPRDHSDFIKTLSPENAATVPKGPDAKWRFFWRIGDRPKETKYAELNAPPVIPEKFKNEWPQTMDKWGNLMLQACNTVAEMLAVGLGLAKETFTSRMNLAPHLLAPTGSDLTKHGDLGRIFAGFHYDLNFMTIHGKSRFPGLHIWLRDKTRVPVRVPDGCLLLQAGIQLERLTGGVITAGYHEVVVNESTLEAIEKAKQENRPLWRVSSTLFSHIASDVVLEPLAPYDTPEAKQKYPPILTGDQVLEELTHIKLIDPNLQQH